MICLTHMLQLGSMREAGIKLDLVGDENVRGFRKEKEEEAWETRKQELEELKAKMLVAGAPLALDDIFLTTYVGILVCLLD